MACRRALVESGTGSSSLSCCGDRHTGFAKTRLELAKRELVVARAQDDDDINCSRKLRLIGTKNLPHQSLAAVALHRIPDTLTGNDPEATFRAFLGPTLAPLQNKRPALGAFTLGADLMKVALCSQALGSRYAHCHRGTETGADCLSGEALTTLGAACSQNLAATYSGFASAIAEFACTLQLGRTVCWHHSKCLL